MQESRIAQYAPLTGIVYVVFMLTGIALSGSPGYRPPAERVVEYFTQSSDRIIAGHYFGIVSVIFLLWFAGSLARALRGEGGDTERLSTIAFAGAVFTAVALVVGVGLLGVGADLAARPTGITPEVGALIHRMYSKLMASTLSIGLAVMIGATGVASLRGGLFPAWFGWASLIMTVLLVTPFHWLMEIASFPWIVFASVWIARRDSIQSESESRSNRAGVLEPSAKPTR